MRKASFQVSIQPKVIHNRDHRTESEARGLTYLYRSQMPAHPSSPPIPHTPNHSTPPSAARVKQVITCVGNTVGIMPEEVKQNVYKEMMRLAGDDGLFVVVYWNGNRFGDAVQNFYHKNPQLCGPFTGECIDLDTCTLTTPSGGCCSALLCCVICRASLAPCSPSPPLPLPSPPLQTSPRHLANTYKATGRTGRLQRRRAASSRSRSVQRS